MANRRQHTIPQFYLRQFLSPGWVYRLGADSPRATKNPSGVAVQRDYYGRDKASRETLDKLNSMVESNGAPVFRKLIDNPGTITEGDWVVLSYLFANFAVRTPAVIEEIRATELELVAQANAMARKMTERLIEASLAGSDLSEFRSEPSGDFPTMTLDQMKEHADRLRAEGGHRIAALDIFYALVDIAECIQQMSFWVVESPRNRFFVTSDRSLTLQSRVTGSRVGAGWENSDALGLIALSPSHFLLMCYAKPLGIRSTLATPEQVAGLNLETIKFADQEIYSPFKYYEADDWMKGLGRWSPQR